MNNHKVTRREFIGVSTAAALGCSCLRSQAFGEAPVPLEKPNIIFIMADDLGYADLGCYGQKHIQTPNIDRLAAEGMRFTQCYAGASVCAPSRCVLMTGRHTGHATVRGNHGENTPAHDGEKGRIPLRENDITIAKILKQAGYATAITGKWGLGEPGSNGLPNDHGFDEWLGYLNQKHAADYYTDHLWHNNELQTIEANKDGKRAVYSADLFAEFSLDFIQKNQGNPFFLYLATTIPHKNLEVPDLGVYADKAWPEEAKVFAAMVSRMDMHVGRIMALLKELNLERNTIVFFTSDNGAAKGWEGLFDSCGPLRGKKFTFYEGGIRVPMIVRWPEQISPGKVSDTVWYFADVLPTLATFANTTAPAEIDGINVGPVLLEQNTPLPERYLYWEVRRDKPESLEQAVRRGDWKARRSGTDKPLELYNLMSDIGEKEDVAGQYPEVVSRIEDYLKTARIPSPYWSLESER